MRRELRGASADSYAEILNYVSHIGAEGTRHRELRGGPRPARRSRGTWSHRPRRGLGAYADVSDPGSASRQMVLGRGLADAEKLEHETLRISREECWRGKTRRPALDGERAGSARTCFSGALAARRGDIVEAIRQASSSERAQRDYVRFNPADLNAWQYVVIGQSQLAAHELELGQVSEALAQLRAASALDQDSRSPPAWDGCWLQTRIELMRLESRTGRAAAQQVLKQIAGAVDERREQVKGDPERQSPASFLTIALGTAVRVCARRFRARVWRSGRDRPASRRPADLGRQHVGQQHARFFAARRFASRRCPHSQRADSLTRKHWRGVARSLQPLIPGPECGPEG